MMRWKWCYASIQVLEFGLCPVRSSTRTSPKLKTSIFTVKLPVIRNSLPGSQNSPVFFFGNISFTWWNQLSLLWNVHPEVCSLSWHPHEWLEGLLKNANNQVQVQFQQLPSNEYDEKGFHLRWICKLVNALWSAKIVRVAFDHILVANFMLKFLVHLSLVC